MNRPKLKSVSGGQTGADRAALDRAVKNGIPHGGWCPKDRRAEDGPIDAKYQLKETPLSLDFIPQSLIGPGTTDRNSLRG